MSFLIKTLAGCATVFGSYLIGECMATGLEKGEQYSEEIIADTLRLADEIKLYKTPIADAMAAVVSAAFLLREIRKMGKEE